MICAKCKQKALVQDLISKQPKNVYYEKKKGRGSQWIFKMQIACDLLECLIKKKPMIALGVIYISISIPMPKKKGGQKR